MRRAALEELRDLGGGDEVHLDAGQPVDLALVAARRARPCATASPALASAALHCSIRRPLEGSARTSLPSRRSWRALPAAPPAAARCGCRRRPPARAPARRHRPAGCRSGRRRRPGSWGRAPARSPRTRSPCSTRGCGRTRRRTRRPPMIDAGLLDADRGAAAKASSAGGEVDACGARSSAIRRRRARAPAPSRRRSSRSARPSRRGSGVARASAASASRRCGDLGRRARADQLEARLLQVLEHQRFGARRHRPGSSRVDQLARQRSAPQPAAPEVSRVSSARNASGRQNWCLQARRQRSGMGSALMQRGEQAEIADAQLNCARGPRRAAPRR